MAIFFYTFFNSFFFVNLMLFLKIFFFKSNKFLVEIFLVQTDSSCFRELFRFIFIFTMERRLIFCCFYNVLEYFFTWCSTFNHMWKWNIILYLTLHIFLQHLLLQQTPAMCGIKGKKSFLMYSENNLYSHKKKNSIHAYETILLSF